MSAAHWNTGQEALLVGNVTMYGRMWKVGDRVASVCLVPFMHFDEDSGRVMGIANRAVALVTEPDDHRKLGEVKGYPVAAKGRVATLNEPLAVRGTEVVDAFLVGKLDPDPTARMKGLFATNGAILSVRGDQLVPVRTILSSADDDGTRGKPQIWHSRVL